MVFLRKRHKERKKKRGNDCSLWKKTRSYRSLCVAVGIAVTLIDCYQSIENSNTKWEVIVCCSDQIRPIIHTLSRSEPFHSRVKANINQHIIWCNYFFHFNNFKLIRKSNHRIESLMDSFESIISIACWSKDKQCIFRLIWLFSHFIFARDSIIKFVFFPFLFIVLMLLLPRLFAPL